MSARRLTGSAAPSPVALFAPLADYRTIGLAVSGGPDSLALMLLAAEYARSHDVPAFIVYSVDHGLRTEAADEVQFVIGEAARLGLPARGLRWTGRKPKSRVQEAARAARYTLIGEAMREDGATVLVTAHHLHDQAETVLMRLAHGSGIEGLSGMDYATEIAGVTIVRPLLGIDPAELSAVVERAGLTAVADPSNSDTGYERVRWRAMLPRLGALGLTPERLGLLALRMRDADRVIDAVAGSNAATATDNGHVVSRDLLQRLPRAVAVRVVQNALRAAGDKRKPHALAAVEQLTERLIEGPVRTTLHGCIVRSDGTTIRIRPEPLTGARARRRQPTKP